MFAFQGAEIVLPVPHPCTNSFRGWFDVRPSRCKFEAIARATAGLAAAATAAAWLATTTTTTALAHSDLPGRRPLHCGAADGGHAPLIVKRKIKMLSAERPIASCHDAFATVRIPIAVTIGLQ